MKAKNFKRTFVDQSNFSYFNTIMDEDLAQKKLQKRMHTRRPDDSQPEKRKLTLQNGDIIEEDSDETDNITESMASEQAALEGNQLM